MTCSLPLSPSLDLHTGKMADKSFYPPFHNHKRWIYSGGYHVPASAALNEVSKFCRLTVSAAREEKNGKHFSGCTSMCRDDIMHQQDVRAHCQPAKDAWTQEQFVGPACIECHPIRKTEIFLQNGNLKTCGHWWILNLQSKQPKSQGLCVIIQIPYMHHG